MTSIVPMPSVNAASSSLSSIPVLGTVGASDDLYSDVSEDIGASLALLVYMPTVPLSRRCSCCRCKQTALLA